MKQSLKVLFATLFLASFATCMAPALQQSKGTGADIGLKIKRLDLLNQIIPVLMTKQQMRKILPVVQKARQEEANLEKLEKAQMQKFNARIDKAIKDAEEKQVLPDTKLIVELRGLHSTLALARTVMIGQQVDKVITVMKDTLNEGQINSAVKSVDPATFGNGVKPEMSDNAKLKLWVQFVLMDPIGYSIIYDMSA